MDPQDDQPDTHAVARERREDKRRRGMQVTGRSTKTVLPGVIAKRGREADEQLRKRQASDPVTPAQDDPKD